MQRKKTYAVEKQCDIKTTSKEYLRKTKNNFLMTSLFENRYYNCGSKWIWEK